MRARHAAVRVGQRIPDVRPAVHVRGPRVAGLGLELAAGAARRRRNDVPAVPVAAGGRRRGLRPDARRARRLLPRRSVRAR